MRNLLSFKCLKNKRARLCFALLFIAYAFVFTSFNARSQQTYFEKRIDHHNNYDYSSNIIVLDSGYMIAGFTEDSVYMYDIHLAFTGINDEGEINLFKEYGYDSINMFLGDPGSLIKYGSNKYYTVGTKRIYISDWVHDEGMLACYNNIFDTLWTKYYGVKNIPYDTAFMFYQIKKTSNNNLIITGLRLPEFTASRIQVVGAVLRRRKRVFSGAQCGTNRRWRICYWSV